MGDSFAGVENILWDNFFLAFSSEIKISHPRIENLSTILVNKSGLGLPNPVTSMEKIYPSLQCASTELIRSVTGEGNFSTTNCLLALKEERRDGKKIRIMPMTPNSRD